MVSVSYTDGEGYTITIVQKDANDDMLTRSDLELIEKFKADPSKFVRPGFSVDVDAVVNRIKNDAGHRKGRTYITSPGGEKIESGFWMDFPEPEWNISDKAYYKLPIQRRMEMEAKQQATAYEPLSAEFTRRRKMMTRESMIRNLFGEPLLNEDRQADELLLDDEIEEKAPPGRERQVKALKKVKGVKNPYAMAWASYGKRKK